MVTRALLTALLMAIAGGAAAQGKRLAFDGTRDMIFWAETRFSVRVIDEVNDGCLPKPNALRDKAELTLRRSGFEFASDGTPFATEIRIFALGYKQDFGACVVFVEMELVKDLFLPVPFADDYGTGETISYVTYNVLGRLLTGPPDSMQERVEKALVDGVDQVFLVVERAREKVEKDWPLMAERRTKLLEKYRKQ